MHEVSPHKPIRLHLGCQDQYLPGYVNIDLPPSEHTAEQVKADVYADVRDLRYESDSVDEVRSHHMLEHFSRQEALVLLARWHRWLRPGGLLMAETPDFEESARKFLSADQDQQFKLARHIFGSHEAGWAYHRDFWSEKKFRYVLGELGFDDMRFEKFSNNLEQKCSALRGTFVAKQEKLMNVLGGLGFNTLPNIVVYATKGNRSVDYYAVIRKILEKSLVGREQAILDVWLKEVEGKI